MQRKRPTRYVVPDDMIYFTGIKSRDFENHEILLEANGRVTVKKGFPSDGCSPTFKMPFSKFFQFGWVMGPPNGPNDPVTGLPISARAFFLHDALLDHVRDLVKAKEIHREFCREINKTEWRWKRQACWLVCKFGPSK